MMGIFLPVVLGFLIIVSTGLLLTVIFFLFPFFIILVFSFLLLFIFLFFIVLMMSLRLRFFISGFRFGFWMSWFSIILFSRRRGCLFWLIFLRGVIRFKNCFDSLGVRSLIIKYFVNQV